MKSKTTFKNYNLFSSEPTLFNSKTGQAMTDKEVKELKDKETKEKLKKSQTKLF